MESTDDMIRAHTKRLTAKGPNAKFRADCACEMALAKVSIASRDKTDALPLEPEFLAFGLHRHYDFAFALPSLGVVSAVGASSGSHPELAVLALAVPFKNMSNRFVSACLVDCAENPGVLSLVASCVRATIGGFYPWSAVPSLRVRFDLMEQFGVGLDLAQFCVWITQHRTVIMTCIREYVCWLVGIDGVVGKIARETTAYADGEEQRENPASCACMWDAFDTATRVTADQIRALWSTHSSFDVESTVAQGAQKSRLGTFRPATGWFWSAAVTAVSRGVAAPAAPPDPPIRFDSRFVYDGVAATISAARRAGCSAAVSFALARNARQKTNGF